MTVALDTLLDRSSGRALPLPPGLAERYGGALSFPEARPYVVANFVSTLDGVVSYAVPGRSEASVVSGGNEGDRFVLALLRACADAIVVGAGTLREERDHLWTPEFVYPEAADEFAALRRAMGKPERALVAFVSASGNVDRTAPIFRSGVPTRVLTGHLRARGLIDALGLRDPLIVTEGGPTLFGELLRDAAVDELFLTLAPRLAGRDVGMPRKALVEAQAFAPDRSPRASVVSLKAQGDFVFARYRIARG